MRRTALLLTAVLALSACTLLTPDAPAGPAAPLPELAAALARGANDSATVTLAADPQRVLVAPGGKTLYLSAAIITGGDLRYHDARCGDTARAEVTCTYNDLEVPEPHKFGQPVGGTNVHGTVLYRRVPGGDLFAKTF